MQTLYKGQYDAQESYFELACNKSGTGKIKIQTDESYVKALLKHILSREDEVKYLLIIFGVQLFALFGQCHFQMRVDTNAGLIGEPIKIGFTGSYTI